VKPGHRPAREAASNPQMWLRCRTHPPLLDAGHFSRPKRGTILRPHRHKDGCFVVSPDRYAKNFCAGGQRSGPAALGGARLQRAPERWRWARVQPDRPCLDPQQRRLTPATRWLPLRRRPPAPATGCKCPPALERTILIHGQRRSDRTTDGRADLLSADCVEKLGPLISRRNTCRNRLLRTRQETRSSGG
jgi:hypothetical protein